MHACLKFANICIYIYLHSIHPSIDIPILPIYICNYLSDDVEATPATVHKLSLIWHPQTDLSFWYEINHRLQLGMFRPQSVYPWSGIHGVGTLLSPPEKFKGQTTVLLLVLGAHFRKGSPKPQTSKTWNQKMALNFRGVFIHEQT